MVNKVIDKYQKYKMKFESSYIIYVKKSEYDGLWYSGHVGEYFLVEIDNRDFNFRGCFKAIICLTKNVATVEWEDRLSGWFNHNDVIKISEQQLKTIFERSDKLDTILS